MSYQTKATGWTLTPARRAANERGRSGHVAAGAGRREDYYWLLAEERMPWRLAADRIGVTHRQAQRWNATRRCRCGHAAEFHNLSTDRRRRTTCTVHTGPRATPCGCEAYEPEEVTA